MGLRKRIIEELGLPDLSNHVRVGNSLLPPDLTFEWVDVLEITKTEEGLNFPIVDSKLNSELQQGVYQLLYKDAVIKNGCFGEGMSKGIKKRFSVYRSMVNKLDLVREGSLCKNGSFKTIDLLDSRLKVGDKVQVRAAGLPANKFIDNIPWKVDLYTLEAYLKELNKDTIWLN